MTDFSTRDPDAPAFWDERFEQGFMPWDQQGVPPAFVEFALGLTPCQVLIPGCGSAYEAGWLASRGWNVTAIDFSPAAVRAARAHLAKGDGIGAVRACDADAARTGGIDSVDLRVADFFTFDPAPLPHWIYERAFLCALPPARRADYARRMAGLVAPGGLLAGLFFLGETGKKGPPFAIGEAELHALLTPYFECVDERAVSGSLAVFDESERWITWRRRS